VDNSPDEYKADNFLIDNLPLVITSRYGQNQHLSLAQDDEDEDAENWKKDRDFTRIRYIFLAIATQLR
jgi:hypothetical protein